MQKECSTYVNVCVCVLCIVNAACLCSMEHGTLWDDGANDDGAAAAAAADENRMRRGKSK